MQEIDCSTRFVVEKLPLISLQPELSSPRFLRYVLTGIF